MGSFRSQPDLVKYTTVKQGTGLSFAVSHMCGKYCPIQAGESTWKTHTSRSLLSQTKRTPFSAYSTATEVLDHPLRRRSIHLCRTSLC